LPGSKYADDARDGGAEEGEERGAEVEVEVEVGLLMAVEVCWGGLSVEEVDWDAASSAVDDDDGSVAAAAAAVVVDAVNAVRPSAVAKS
jgi:hypothetical protein